MGRENNGKINLNGNENIYIVGPLNLNRRTKRANTVMGEELVLDNNEFDALDILAFNEGEYLTFNQLYQAVWGNTENKKTKEAARSALENLVKQINAAGGEFMWIDHVPGAEYTFNTCWGHKWQQHNEKAVSHKKTYYAVSKDMPRKHRKPQYRAILAGVGAFV
jgi:DNA-binding response OmpR family regulator